MEGVSLPLLIPLSLYPSLAYNKHQHKLKSLITICVRRYYNLPRPAIITKCCKPISKCQAFIYTNGATLITKCVSYY